MEYCKTKEELVEYYTQHYDSQFYRGWVELSLTKLTGFNTWKQGNLTPLQITTFKNLLLNENFNKEHFLSALNLLTYEQISYVGW